VKVKIDHLLDVWRIEPALCYGGFNQGDRTQLVSAISEVQLCYDWLQQQDIGQRVTANSHGSYYLKHAVEFSTMRRSMLDYLYVSNGAFLAAVIIAGVPYQRCNHRGPNALVAVKGSRRNRKLHGAKAEHSLCYAEYMPLSVMPVATIMIGDFLHE
jgi:hypothetical protein